MTHARSGLVVSGASSLVGCLLLAACGSSGPPIHAVAPHAGGGASHSPAAGANAAACSLIDERDVTTAVGNDPGPGSANNGHGATACTYGGYPKPVLTVNVLPTQGRLAYDRFRQDPKLTSGTGLSVAAVSGLGDQAFELSSPHVDAVYLTKGDTLIVIGFSAPTSPPKGAALTLAKIAAGRL